MSPEFSEFLETTPKADRTGFVFCPTLDGKRPRADTASKVIRRIGKAAGVLVGEYDRSEKSRFASAHDLRRSFGLRWALQVLPPVLKELMRHSSIETTMRYYVGVNAQATADAVWEAIANTSANTGSEAAQTEETENAASC